MLLLAWQKQLGIILHYGNTKKRKKDWEGWGWAVCPEGLGEVVFGDVNNVLLGPCIANSYTLFLLVSLAVSGWFGRYFVFWSLV